LKNGLDWVVGSGEFVDKPVALINASSRGTYAQASLITLEGFGRSLDAAAVVADPRFSAPLRAGLDAFLRAIEKQRE
jgi:chromate reductase